MPTAVERLAQAAHDVAKPQGDAAAWHARAARHVLDWLGCAASGAVTPQGRIFGRWLATQAAGHCPTLAGRHADGAAAAAYHGALGSALEMDDIHRSSILHPGPVVIPAVLAAAAPHTPGAVLLGAIVAGYEVTIRTGRALGPSHYRLWHTTATAGTFGAAAGAAAVLGLDAAQTAQALALAGTRAGGLWQVRHEDSLGKAWHMAGAARDGLAAAQLAAAGLSGPLGVLDGPSGWFAATAPSADAARIDEACGGHTGTPWLADVSFKPWPACRHAHPALDALFEALDGHTVAEADVARIDVHTYADALRFCARADPVDTPQARFSIPHALAAALRWGAPLLEHYEASVLQAPGLQALRDKVCLHAGPEMEARYPAHYGARVVLTLHDGRQLQATLHDTRGDPARPLPPAALQDKAQVLMTAGGWAPPRIAAAIAACAELPQAGHLHGLHAVISGIKVGMMDAP
jgi:2-methylcitrate dehydratase PrpD